MSPLGRLILPVLVLSALAGDDVARGATFGRRSFDHPAVAREAIGFQPHGTACSEERALFEVIGTHNRKLARESDQHALVDLEFGRRKQVVVRR